ncbi:MAG: polyisoprenoid-binding protein [Candidatus Omnitrophica bacterium]|nr:polyisoprenoid-binding protein [Candidatus Omnitrophota bacterium]
MNKLKILILVAILGLSFNTVSYSQEAAAPVAPAAQAVSYEIDAVHSTLGFTVKHMAVGTTRGSFSDYKGTVVFDPNDFSTFQADVTINAASIDTNNEGRDKHLKGADFFDAEKFPEITFKSTRLEKNGAGAVIVGNLTMKGVTKEITIPVQITGPIASPHGANVIGLEGQVQVNRQDYGISFSKALDNGGLMVGDNVNIIIEIEAGHKS